MKLKFVSDQEQLFPLKHALHEVIPAPRFRDELLVRVDGGVDFATEARFGCTQRLRDVGELDVANHEHVHVAASPFLATSDGAIDERNPDAR